MDAVSEQQVSKRHHRGPRELMGSSSLVLSRTFCVYFRFHGPLPRMGHVACYSTTQRKRLSLSLSLSIYIYPYINVVNTCKYIYNMTYIHMG